MGRWTDAWGGTFVVWEAVEEATLPVYGAPFLDFQLALPMNLDRFHSMNLSSVCRIGSHRLDLEGGDP